MLFLGCFGYFFCHFIGPKICIMAVIPICCSCGVVFLALILLSVYFLLESMQLSAIHGSAGFQYWVSCTLLQLVQSPLLIL